MAFGGFLKQSTAVDVLIGPFLDKDDGDTEENALTISQGDILLSKNGQGLTQKTDVTAAAFDASGYYNCELDATDTNTLGILTVIVHKSGALSVRLDFEILSSDNYTYFVETVMSTVSITSTETKTWTAAVELAVTTGFGGAVDVLAADQKIDYTGDVDLETNGYEGAQVLIETKRIPGTTRKQHVPDDFIIDVFASLDGALYDTIPYITATIRSERAELDQRFTFVIQDLTHFRIGLRTNGTDDTFDYRITHQTWLIDNA